MTSPDPSAEATPRPVSPVPAWAKLTATFFGIGFMRPGPGTWGSAAALLLWTIASRTIPQSALSWCTGAAIAASVALGIPAATRVAQAYARKDPQFVVIDEVAGQLLALWLAPATWKSAALGFILFRAFDITKPPPVRQLERLPSGTGIVVDDLGAGLYALALMQLAAHFGILST